MGRKLLLSYMIIIFVAVGISAAVFWSQGYRFINRMTLDQYLEEAGILADALEQAENLGDMDYQAFAKWYADKYQIRITLISSQGQVLADSGKTSELENHATREEVVKALKGEAVSVTRYSKTMGQDYCYSAVPAVIGKDLGVLRVSIPLSDLKGLDESLNRSVLYALFACILLAIVLALIFTRMITEPIREVAEAAEKISEGDYSIKIYTREKAELGRLTKSFNIMALNLKASMQKLTQRNIELEAMLGSMDSGVIAVDEANTVLFYNQSFDRLVGNRSKDYKGKALYHVLRNGATFQVIDAVRKSGESQVREGHLIGGESEEPKMLRVTATPLLSRNKKRLGVLMILEDMTQIKKLENVRRDFVSNVTHELKTPLTSIRGFIETLKSGALEDRETARRFLDIIDIEAERLYSLIQDILILSEIEQKKDGQAVACNVDSCIRSVLELLEGNLNPGVSISYEPAPYRKPYSCNPDRMKQLLINLLDNAIKYTEQGSIEIRCREQASMLVISIKDSGIGMEKEDLSRIFERFYRVDKSRSREKGGTGLGLSIVKHIVELYHGTIHVESKVGKGTLFEIQLPY